MKRFGIVGAGIWGTMHARAYAQHPSADLVAICDLDEERARDLADQYEVPKVFTDVDRLLEEELDGLSVVTPDNAHAEIVLKAVAGGVHVLVEKPLATTLDECRRMVSAAAAAGVILMVDWHNRWNPPVYHAWKSIREGELGDLRYIYYRLSDTVYVPTRMLPWAGRSSVMWFLGSHALDTVCWLMGQTPTRIFSHHREGVLADLGVDTPDLTITMLDFANGATAVIENCWIIPQTSPSLIDHRCQVLGTAGALYLDLTHNRSVAKYTMETSAGYPHPTFPDMLITPEIHGRQMGFAVESIYHFVECVRDGRTPLATGEDGLRNTRLILAAEDSAERECWIDLTWGQLH